MQQLTFFVVSIFWFAFIDASFINPYPRYKYYRDNDDPGEPLFLTKYIENGDIELV